MGASAAGADFASQFGAGQGQQSARLCPEFTAPTGGFAVRRWLGLCVPKAGANRHCCARGRYSALCAGGQCRLPALRLRPGACPWGRVCSKPCKPKAIALMPRQCICLFPVPMVWCWRCLPPRSALQISTHSLEQGLLEVFASNAMIAFENLQLYLDINALAFSDDLRACPTATPWWRRWMPSNTRKGCWPCSI